jgi:ZIP family zinc transporter/zinc and cadmium transporter
MTAIALALVAGAANLLGALVVVRRSGRGVRALELSIALGAGFMLAVVLLRMLPEAFAAGAAPAPWVLAGFLAVHLAQHVLTPHFHFGEETHHVSPAAGASAVLGLSLHTFFDGVAIASGLLVSPELGALLFVAVFLHKLPEGLSVASLVLAGGSTPRRALVLSLVPALATLLGAIVTTRASGLATHGLAISAGVTLYVAASNLVPEFQGKRGWPSAVAFFGGVLAYVGTNALLLRSIGG